jgi:hypothetical protein
VQIPNCVPEYYREQEEREQYEYEKSLKKAMYYEESNRRLEEATECGYPVLYFGGYRSCAGCKKKFDVQLNEEDDLCALICYDVSCVCHKNGGR